MEVCIQKQVMKETKLSVERQKAMEEEERKETEKEENVKLVKSQGRNLRMKNKDKNNLTENKDSKSYIISHKLVSDGVEVTIKKGWRQ